MKLLSVQVALFPKENIVRPDITMGEINQRLGYAMDAMPTILNIPQDFPNEIPVASVNSTNGVYTLNIARGRVDLIIKPAIDMGTEPFDVFQAYKDSMEKYCQQVLEQNQVIRLGVILTMFHAVAENTKAIHSKYFKEPMAAGCIETSIKTNKRNKHKNIQLNNITLIEAAELELGKGHKKGVVIQFDINNVPNVDKPLTVDSITSILAYASNKIKSTALKELI